MTAAGWVRVDCHLHTVASGDAVTTLDQLAERVARNRIDVVCITDHNTVCGALALRDRLPVRVVVGQEVKTSVGEIIGLFLTECVPHGVKPAEAAARIHDQGGLVYVPHPYDPMRSCLRQEAIEAICVGKLALVDQRRRTDSECLELLGRQRYRTRLDRGTIES